MGNVIMLKEFLFLGFGSFHEIQFSLLGIFLGIYVVAFMGKHSHPYSHYLELRLQTPMDIFLFNFSFLEI